MCKSNLIQNCLVFGGNFLWRSRSTSRRATAQPWVSQTKRRLMSLSQRLLAYCYCRTPWLPFNGCLLYSRYYHVLFFSEMFLLRISQFQCHLYIFIQCTSVYVEYLGLSADPDDQEGCLESFAHANQHLAKPKPTGCRVPCVPCGGAQMLRLLSSKALRDATGGCLPEEFKHLACWRDTGRCSTISDDHL